MKRNYSATKAPIPIVNFQLSIFNCLCLGGYVNSYDETSIGKRQAVDRIDYL